MIHDFLKRHTKLKWTFVGALALFAIYVCFGVWGVPALLKSQLSKQGSALLGREVTLEEASFNPFTLEARLYGLRVSGEKEGEPDLLEIGRMAANAQITSALPGRVELKFVEVSDGIARVAIAPNGTFSFQDILDSLPSPAEEPEAEETDPLAARVQRVSIDGFSVEFEDRSLEEPYRETVTLTTFEGRDIGTIAKERKDGADTAGRFFHWDFNAALSTASGAQMALEGGAESVSPWAFAVRTTVDGFPLASAQPYVSGTVLATVEGSYGNDFWITARLPEEGSPQISATGSLALDGLAVSDSERRYFSARRLGLNEVAFDLVKMALTIEEAYVEAPGGELALAPDGSLVLPAFAESGEPAAETAAASEGQAAPALTARVERIRISDGDFSVEDRSLDPPFVARIDEAQLEVRGVSATMEEAGVELSADATLSLRVLDGRLSFEGALASLRGGATGGGTLRLERLNLAELQPYVSAYSYAALENGRLSGELEASLGETLKAGGQIGVEELLVAYEGDDKEVTQVKKIGIEGIAMEGQRLSIDGIYLEEPALSIWQDDVGLSLTRLAKQVAADEKMVESKAAEVGIEYVVNVFELRKGSIDFIDTSLVSTHNSRVRDLSVIVNNISSTPGELASFQFSATIDEVARLSGSGKMDMADPAKALDLDIAFEGYDLRSTSPYFETYLARSLADGRFRIESNYQVRDNILEGSNSFRIEDLTLGTRVESERAISLPIGFAIKLMKDPSGVISYNGLRVSGDLSDPKVGVWGIIGKAFSNLVLNAASAPFKFLANMVGGREDLDTIAFKEGEIALSTEGRDKVSSLGKILSQRPELTLEVAFRPDVEADRRLLKRRYVMHTLANPEQAIAGAETLLRPVNESTLNAALESRYRELIEAEAQAAETGAEETPSAEASGPMENDGAATREVVGPAASKTDPALAADDATEDKERKPGILKRVARFFGFGGAKDTNESEATVANTAQTRPASSDRPASGSAQAQSQSDEDGPEPEFPQATQDEMLAEVIASYPDSVVKAAWIEDLERLRIENFMAALATEGVGADRTRAVEPSSVETSGAPGSLLLGFAER